MDIWREQFCSSWRTSGEVCSFSDRSRPIENLISADSSLVPAVSLSSVRSDSIGYQGQGMSTAFTVRCLATCSEKANAKDIKREGRVTYAFPTSRSRSVCALMKVEVGSRTEFPSLESWARMPPQISCSMTCADLDAGLILV